MEITSFCRDGGTGGKTHNTGRRRGPRAKPAQVATLTASLTTAVIVGRQLRLSGNGDVEMLRYASTCEGSFVDATNNPAGASGVPLSLASSRDAGANVRVVHDQAVTRESQRSAIAEAGRLIVEDDVPLLVGKARVTLLQPLHCELARANVKTSSWCSRFASWARISTQCAVIYQRFEPIAGGL